MSRTAHRAQVTSRMTLRFAIIRLLAVITAILGLNYIVWRLLFSVNPEALWIAIPLVLAETYSLIDSLLFGLTMWRARDRPKPPAPQPGLTVDVFIATYNEPLDLVMETARAAQRITYPHKTWVLDDGNRTELRDLAEAEGIGWITRSADWSGRARHAKAGNLNNALLTTEGEFMLILDADQVPEPEILDRTLGYFDDRRMALVQTPQVFVNVPDADPLGSQAPLFYGPIQQGKDGWNAAFFCGSNAILRREALMLLGVSRYVTDIEISVFRALRTAGDVIDKAREELEPDQVELRKALDDVAYDVRRARAELRRGQRLADVTYRFQKRVDSIAARMVQDDMAALHADLAEIAALAGRHSADRDAVSLVDETAMARLSERDWSPLGALDAVRAIVREIDVHRDDDAQSIMPLATISVTEDMATCMRLHGLGWKSAYHDETLAYGLAPEDLPTMLTQRLRWAQGTIQVFFRENPLLQKALSIPQRLMYFATMWSYFSGFTAVVYVAAPIIYLVFGVLPVQALSTDFFVRLIPFLIVNQLLFAVVGRGKRTWRGQQYSLALFPVWISSVTTAVANVFFRKPLDFAVTPKVRAESGKPRWDLVKPQLYVIGALIVASAIGLLRLAVGQATPLGTFTNLAWVVFDLAIFSIIIRAARYRGFTPAKEDA
ncbi:glycosyltransferase family 2 protein [Clavibacter michiganensis]|uniref:Cellulose synthase catalytic subunit, UDP-forming n=1 Tax=Clavibacter michiganensis TaxID=28447 RepID=A0A251YVS3_9MICO|nr:glycosyltransferase family 2 protein [Clavibacter michiganensis]OUE28269.1 Cellulose synthase catalytic subunit, UDP-forming [Clavibacter michiganensis]